MLDRKIETKFIFKMSSKKVYKMKNLEILRNRSRQIFAIIILIKILSWITRYQCEIKKKSLWLSNYKSLKFKNCRGKKWNIKTKRSKINSVYKYKKLLQSAKKE